MTGNGLFKKAGIIFFKGSSQSVVLEVGKHLDIAMPQIETSKGHCSSF